MRVHRIEHQTKLERKLIAYAQKCSWMAGPHLAELLIDNRLEEWEVAFALLDDRENVVGFCTFLKTDYDPENRYSPWISTIFVDEQVRGRHLSGLLIEAATAYAGHAVLQGFISLRIWRAFMKNMDLNPLTIW